MAVIITNKSFKVNVCIMTCDESGRSHSQAVNNKYYMVQFLLLHLTLESLEHRIIRIERNEFLFLIFIIFGIYIIDCRHYLFFIF